MPQLAQLIRTKYPGQYDDLSDADLEKAVLAKHPDYVDLATKDHNNPTVPTTQGKPDTAPDEAVSGAKKYLSDTSDKSNNTQVTEKQPEGFLSRAWKTLSSPLTDLPSKAASYLADKIDEPRLNQSPDVASMKGFLAGATKSAGDLVSGLTSPLNLGLSVTGAAEASPLLEAIRPEMTGLRRLLSAPVAIHGASQAVTAPTIPGKLMGGLEAIIGAAGVAHGSAPAIPEESPVNLNPSGAHIPDVNPALPPEFVPQGGEAEFNSTVSQPAVNPEERLMELARQKHGMGSEIPEDKISNSGPIDDNPLTFDEASSRLNDLREKSRNNTISSREIPEANRLDKLLRDANFDKQSYNKMNGIKSDQPELAGTELYGESADDVFSKPGGKSEFSFKSKSPNLVDRMQSFAKQEKSPNDFAANQETSRDIFPTDKADPEIIADRTANPDKPRYRMDSESGSFIPLDKDGNQIGPAVIPGKSIPDELMKSSKYKSATPEQKTSMLQKIYDTPRGLMSVDLPFVTSAAFRQASPYVGTRDWFKAFVPAAKAYGSTDAYNAIHDAIESHPDFELSENSGLAQTNLGKYSNREEQFRSELAEKIPGYGKVVQASNRAYTSFLNSLRFNRFTSLIDDARKSGLDPDQNPQVAKEIASSINTLTGRGKLSLDANGTQANIEKHVGLLSNIFFSPRKIASEIQMLNPSTYMMTNPVARKELVSGLIRRVGTWWAIAGLAKTAGAQVSTDPSNPDFGKIKIGSTRFDPPGGLQQYLVLASQMVEGGKTSSNTGKFSEFGKGFKPETIGSDVANFAFNRLHPTARYLADAFSGTQKTPFHMGDRTMQLAAPMFASDIAQAAKDDPSLLQILGVGGLSGTGAGVQTYSKKFGDPTFLPEKKDINIGAKNPVGSDLKSLFQ